MEARVLVWDLPTRLFHGLFAAAFLAASTIAQVVDDDAAAFRLHMLLGGVMASWPSCASPGPRRLAPRALRRALPPAARRGRLPVARAARPGDAPHGPQPGHERRLVLLLALAWASR